LPEFLNNLPPVKGGEMIFDEHKLIESVLEYNTFIGRGKVLPFRPAVWVSPGGTGGENRT
jgi:hypothetical protein